MVQMIKALILGSLAIATCTLAARDLLERRSLYTVSSGSARTPIVLDALNPSMNQFGYTACTEKAVEMVSDPFSFFRANNPLFLKDLSNQSVVSGSSFYSSKAVTWIQGDMHMPNMGAFDDDHGNIVFDLNDFDQAWIASYLYDVFRLGTSVVLVARNNSMSDTDASAAVTDMATYYIQKLGAFVGNDDEKNFIWTSTQAYGILDNFLDDTAASDTRKKMLDKFSTVVNGHRQFMSNSQNPDVQPSFNSTLKSLIISAIQGSNYRGTLGGSASSSSSFYTVQDVAQYLHAGLGSYGTPRYYAIIEGPSTDASDDIILDIKLQGDPDAKVTNVVPTSNASSFNPAARVASANRALLANADDYIGWITIDGAYYSVRQRSPYKESLTLTSTTPVLTAGQLKNLAQQYAVILAAAHSRSDKDSDSTLVTNQFESQAFNLAPTSSLQAQFASQVTSFALSYATQVAADWQIFKTQYTSGNVCTGGTGR